jgi:hypothetical protein
MIIGWVRDIGNRKLATHIRKGYVGAYNKNSDITTDASGKIYCYGDGCQDLVREADRS